jgi:hypothetical protein
MNKLIKYCLFIFAIFSPLTLNAASVITMSLGEMTNIADDIFVARCVSIESRWQGTKIYTDSVFDVSERVKGVSGSSIKIAALGGTAMHPVLKAPVTMSVSGGVVFEVGQESLLFTKVDAAGDNQVIGLTQGKLLIEVDAETGKKMIAIGQKVLDTTEVSTKNLDYLFSPSTVFDTHGDHIVVRKMELDELLSRLKGLPGAEVLQ